MRKRLINTHSNINIINEQIDKTIEYLNNSQRPVILAGYGIKLSNCSKGIPGTY